ncbi:MAG: hypothetical protein AB7O62_03965 [Pirellulales bacterium]
MILPTPIAMPLFAFDIGGCITLLLPLIGVLVWVFNQIVKNAGQGRPQAGAGPGAAPRRPAVAVDQEIEAFLRRAAQGRGGQPPAGQQPQPPRPQQRQQPMTLQQARAQQARAGRAAPPPLPPGDRPVRKLARTDENPRERESIQEHVSRHINTDDVSQRADHLVTVDQSTTEMAEHVRHSLDHRIGHLATKDSQSVSSAAAAGVSGLVLSAAGAGVAQLLAGRDALRTAIILSEILQRPVDRWDRSRRG